MNNNVLCVGNNALCVGKYVSKFVIGSLCNEQTHIRASYIQHIEFSWPCKNAQCSRDTKVCSLRCRWLYLTLGYHALGVQLQ